MLKTIYHFFRLIRTANLLVIGLTMLVVEVFLNKYKVPKVENIVFKDYSVYDSFNRGQSAIENQLSLFFAWDNLIFWLLVLSTLLIAAAGNIINDYFDVKADRVNKPNRLIIGKYIKRRWAMLLHWSFNIIGLILALYVGYVLQNVWIPLVAFLSINLLWFYSIYYKRKPLIGNVLVAFLLGVIPIYVMLFNLPLSDFSIQEHTITYLISSEYLIVVVIVVSVLAFLQNLTRELVKDIQDIRGDLRLGAETFPIKFGVRRTKWLIGFITVLTIGLVICFFGFVIDNALNQNVENYSDEETVFRLLGISLFFFTSSIVTVLFATKSKTYKIASTLLKFAMLFGLLTPLFL